MIRFAVVVVALSLGWAVQARASELDPGRVSFAVRVLDETVDFRVFGFGIMPEAQLRIAAVGDVELEARAARGKLKRADSGDWLWTAPATSGLTPVTVTDAKSGEVMTLNVFVLVPFSTIKKGVLNGYRIGSYPARTLRNRDIYRTPDGFIEVTEENQDTLLSPHFKLRDFLCKQKGGYPKYVLVRPRLLVKLQYLLERVNEAGIRTDSFTVMSGYRTPFYNKAIGNVKFSRHVWGGAADIFVDTNGDGAMDDLNDDGKINLEDARVLHRLVEAEFDKKRYGGLRGGLGLYRKTSSHPPFIHVDVRGYRARWGD